MYAAQPPKPSPEQLDFLRQVPLFDLLTEQELAQLAQNFRVREVRRDEIIFHQGDPGRDLYLVRRGKVRIFKISPGGQETSIQIFAAHGVIGEFAPLDGQPRSATAKAIEACQLLAIDGAIFEQFMRQMPNLALAMTRMLAKKLRWTAAYAEAIAQYDAAGRLLHILLNYTEQFGQELEPGRRYMLDLALNQTDLASLVGARREWINRLLKNWRDRGLLEYTGGKIIILNLPQVVAERDSRIEANTARW